MNDKIKQEIQSHRQFLAANPLFRLTQRLAEQDPISDDEEDDDLETHQRFEGRQDRFV